MVALEEKEENLVKQVCKEYGITQTELAKKLDVPRGTIGRWTSDGKIPRGMSIALTLMIENKELKEKLLAVKNFKEILDSI